MNIQLLLSIKKRKYTDAGLTLVEVLVSILVSTLFLGTALQAYIAAASLRTASQDTQAAIARIQLDQESLRKLAQVRPQTAADCELPPAGSYARRLMDQVIEQDQELLSSLPNPNSTWGVGAVEVSAQSIQQATTLPVTGLPEEYRFERVLSLDLSGLPTTEDTLQVSYLVRRLQNGIGTEGEGSQNVQTLAKLNTSVIPNAALVCPA
jgi:Tfp pilus assembly protein PilE